MIIERAQTYMELEREIDRLRASHDRLLASGKAIIAHLQHEPLEAGGLLSSNLQAAITAAEELIS
jgi:hypothetical protein